jgi:hypothetical protein
LARGLEGVELAVAAGAAGVVLLPEAVRRGLPGLKVLVDLNAVPPLGIEGVEATDRAPSGRPAGLGRAGRRGHQDEDPQEGDPELFTTNDKISTPRRSSPSAPRWADTYSIASLVFR